MSLNIKGENQRPRSLSLLSKPAKKVTDKCLLPLMVVDKVKFTTPRNGNSMQLRLECKNFQTLIFEICTLYPGTKKDFCAFLTGETGQIKTKKSLSEVQEELVQLFRANKQLPVEKTFAFSYHEYYKTDGYTVYDEQKEYERILGEKLAENNCWRVTLANIDFKLCETYPKFLVVPANVSDGELTEISKFRSKGRIPCLSWLNLKNDASLLRCSQPLTGFSGIRCKEDEQFCAKVISVSKKGQMYILDARPWVNAAGNKMIGAGYEMAANYKNCIIEWMGIANIHAVKDR